MDVLHDRCAALDISKREVKVCLRTPGRRRNYSPEEAQQAAMQFLPDILRYDRTKPVSYPNGRKLIDDDFRYRFTWLTHGKLPATGLKPHDDLTWQFPYLGPPTP